MNKKTDFLVIGSGIAGLSYALKAADAGKVCIVAKSDLEETNTKYAQGGIAAVMRPTDSFEKHINDTIACGDGFCKQDVVEMVIREAPERIRELIDLGVEFDRDPDGKFNLTKEGGHTGNRVLHHKDNTGEEIQHTLKQKVCKHPNIEILEHHFAIDLITQHHLGKKVKRSHADTECYGAYILNPNGSEVFTLLSRTTVIATGGIGNLYHTTTNPVIATGDGIAMVYRAKGKVNDMEFVQFHPTSLYNPGERPSFLISEALRGFGAVLRTMDGNEFMSRYDSRGSLAPRDITARAIDKEMKTRGDDHVLLDATHLDPDKLKENFPNIYKKCKSIGVDITKNMIPVVPAAHYLCGGIKVDKNGKSSIHRLYAIGEASSTGLHGANRMASNSLMEAVVFAHRAAEESKKQFNKYEINNNIPQWNIEGTNYPEEMVLITQNYKEMQQIMSNYVGIVRSNLRLKRALARLKIIYQETEELYKKSTLSVNLCELRNMINVSYLIIKMAQKLRESRGLHYTLDYPSKKRGMEF